MLLQTNFKKKQLIILSVFIFCVSCQYKPGIRLAKLQGILLLDEKCPVVVDILYGHMVPIIWSKQYAVKMHNDGLSISITGWGQVLYDLRFGSSVEFSGGQILAITLSDLEYKRIKIDYSDFANEHFFQIDEIRVLSHSK